MAETYVVIYPTPLNRTQTVQKKLEVGALSLTKPQGAATTSGFDLRTGTLGTAKWCLLQAESEAEAIELVHQTPLSGQSPGKVWLVKEANCIEK